MSTRPLTRLLLLTFTLLLIPMLGSTVARAGIYTYVHRVPIEVGPYQVLQNSDFKLPSPAADGRYGGSERAMILRMSTDITDARGKPVAIQRLMLHHIAFVNAGDPASGRVLDDATCDTLTFPDNRTTIPALAERFYSAGEERSVFDVPRGYGYEVRGTDRWGMLFMVMNHRDQTDRAFIQYTVEYATGPEAALAQPIKPFWLDIENCKADPIFDAPGGGPPGSTVGSTYTWTAPEGMRLIAGQGHVHGGAKLLRIRQRDCGGRTVATSTPIWGNRDHPFYTVKPILHEPGPINMSRFHSDAGIPVAKGQRVELEAIYDNELPHTRVMATFIGAFVPDPTITPEQACGELPAVRYVRSEVSGRTETPRFRIPLVNRPSGAFEARRNRTLRVDRQQFRPGRISLRRGDSLRWIFQTPEGNQNLHDVTLANGPEGFSSPHLSLNRSYRRQFNRPGKYQLFCSLHPMTMTQEILVR